MMTLKQLEKKYSNYTVYYWGKCNHIKDLNDCKHATPYTGLYGIDVKEYKNLEVIDYEVIEQEKTSINFKLTSKGLKGTGVEKRKGDVYALLETNA